MDFRQTPQTTNGHAASVQAHAATKPAEHKSIAPSPDGKNWMQALQLIILAGIAVLLIGIAFGFAHSNSTSGEAKLVNTSKYQAVFLSNGQVYFGKVGSLTSKYIRLDDVYYLTQNSSGDTASNAASANSYSLTQLGKCQIHAPIDEMVLNRDQVTFWENLQNNGKVVTSINQLKKQFPNGQDCSTANSQTQASGNSSQNSQNSTNAGTTGATGTNSSNK